MILLHKNFVRHWLIVCFSESPGILTSPNSSKNSPSGPNSPVEPRSPGSPESSPSGRHLVRRSNSSPEMSDSYRNPFMTQQKIQEDDEEESLTITTSTTKPVQIYSSKTEEFREKERKEKSQKSSTGKGATGLTSPYRTSYEAIPEEVSSSGKEPITMPITKPLSPNKHEKLKHFQEEIKPKQLTDSKTKDNNVDDGLIFPPITRDRGFTISVMNSEARSKGLRRILSSGASDTATFSYKRRDYDSGGESSIRSGVNPSFIFLQLCSQGFFGHGSKPVLLSSSHETSLKVLY